MNSDCVFCDRTKFEERLIAETDALYYIATLGQITDGGYVLVVPRRHVSCIGAMKASEIVWVENAMRTASGAIEEEYGVKPILFEHGIVGQTIPHAHLHLIPADIHLCGKIYRDFPDKQIYFLASFEILRWIYTLTEGNKYLFWSTPEGLLKAVGNPPAPPQYLRTVAAEASGHPERANWRNMDPELDKRLWSETVTRLKPYFL